MHNSSCQSRNYCAFIILTFGTYTNVLTNYLKFKPMICFELNVSFLLEWTTSLDSSSGSLFVRDSGCPRHVGRNYVPLLFGVDTDLRYYVIRDVIVI